jgi:UDPglucose 6-dehydrogenase
MKLAVIGTGYVGLVTGVCFADYGYHVTCIDRDETKIAMLNQGKMPIWEQGLEALVARNVARGKLDFSTSTAQGIQGADVIFVAVGTPARESDGMPDMRALEAVFAELSQVVKAGQLVVIKSTVPVGTTRKMQAVLDAKKCHVKVASNPEFLREGSAIEDFMKPDRIVIGVPDSASKDILMQLYQPITQQHGELFATTPESSELIKYAANSLLAAKVAYINEIADICEKMGANVRDVATGIGLDKRIGPHFLKAGPGVGGSCFPKDTVALTALAREVGAPATIIEAVIRSNDTRKLRMVEKIVAAMGGDVKGKTIAVLGLTFKPATDDMRESPSLVIVPALENLGAIIRAYDPEGMSEAKKLMPNLMYCTDAFDAAKGADALVVITEWNEFMRLDLARLKSLLHVPLVIDLRNIYKRRDMQKAGFTYHSIGRASVSSATTTIMDAFN